jgi:hypothetical protein
VLHSGRWTPVLTGGVEVLFHSLTSALHGGERSASRPAVYFPVLTEFLAKCKIIGVETDGECSMHVGPCIQNFDKRQLQKHRHRCEYNIK